MTQSTRGGVPMLVLVTAMWGVSFPLIGEIMGDDPEENEFVFLALRFALATAVFLPIAPIVRRQSMGRGLLPWMLGAILGVLLFVGYWTQTVGLKYTTPPRSAFVTMLSVPLVPILAALTFRRPPLFVHVAGSLLAVAGVGIVLAPSGSFEPNRGDWWTLACAAVFAVEILAMASFARRVPPAVLTFAMIGTVALCSFFGLAVTEGTQPHYDAAFWVAVGVTGIVCTTLAMGGMTWAQGRVSAETAAIVFALEPVFASLFDYLHTAQTLTRWQWIGGLVVVLAVAWTSRAPTPSEEQPTEPPERPTPAAG
ncbi:MAG: DMT family transporter [Planctomycetes bacterium]|nr:DMT family transporter [Planctomycetota bacterium]